MIVCYQMRDKNWEYVASFEGIRGRISLNCNRLEACSEKCQSFCEGFIKAKMAVIENDESNRYDELKESKPNQLKYYFRSKGSKKKIIVSK